MIKLRHMLCRHTEVEEDWLEADDFEAGWFLEQYLQLAPGERLVIVRCTRCGHIDLR